MHASEGAEQLHGASERLRRAHDRVAAAEAALAQARRDLQAAQRAEYGWTDGLAGRRQVADALAALERYGWLFLDAVHWPGRPGVVIDHVGVGPGGVVVMFSRQWTGAVDVRGGVLRQNGIPRLRETAAVSAAAGAVCALLPPMYRTTVSAFVCAVQHDVRPATVSPGVNVVGVRDVARAVTALSPRLSAQQVEALHATLHNALVGPEVPDQLTTRALTVYGDGPALPWPTRTDDGLFDPAPQPWDDDAAGFGEELDVRLDGDLRDDLAGGHSGGPGGDTGPRPGPRDPYGTVEPPAGPPAVPPPGRSPVPAAPDATGAGHGPAWGGSEEPPALLPVGPPAAAAAVLAGGSCADDGADVLDGWRPETGGVRAGGPVALRGRHRTPPRDGFRPSHHAVRGTDLGAGLMAVVAAAGAGLAGLVAWLGRAVV